MERTYLKQITEALKAELAKEKEFEQQLGLQYIYTDIPKKFHESTFKPHLETGAFVSKSGNLLFYTKFY